MNEAIARGESASIAITVTGHNKPNGLSVSKASSFPPHEWAKLYHSHGSVKYTLRKEIETTACLLLAGWTVLLRKLKGEEGTEIVFDFEAKDHDFFMPLYYYADAARNGEELKLCLRDATTEDLLDVDIEATFFFTYSAPLLL
jgi:hypothetical protein